MIFDTHAHYDDEAFDEDRDTLLGAMPGSSVTGIVNMGASFCGARASRALAEQYAFMYAGAGLHPDNIGELNDDVLQELYHMCRTEKTVTVGEIGLDYHWDVEPRDVQRSGFIRQIELAKETGLPINVHSRDATQDTFDIIRKYHAGTTGGIIHCYSGSAEMAQEYVKMGYRIGIGGVVTFKNAKNLQKVVAAIPIESIVTETDCPYMAPTPYRGERNDSRNIRLVIEKIAELKEIDSAQAETILYANALDAYHLG